MWWTTMHKGMDSELISRSGASRKSKEHEALNSTLHPDNDGGLIEMFNKLDTQGAPANLTLIASCTQIRNSSLFLIQDTISESARIGPMRAAKFVLHFTMRQSGLKASTQTNIGFAAVNASTALTDDPLCPLPPLLALSDCEQAPYTCGVLSFRSPSERLEVIVCSPAIGTPGL